MIRKCFVFLSNLLAFTFLRHTFMEHLRLLAIVLFVFFLIGTTLVVLLNYNVISALGNPGAVITYSAGALESFLNYQKLTYIAVTYIVAFLVHQFVEDVVELQTRRTILSSEALITELRGNTRAVVVTMSNALSLALKLLLGVNLMLAIILLFGCFEGKEQIVSIEKLDDTAFYLLFADFMLFVIQHLYLKHSDKSQLKGGETGISET